MKLKQLKETSGALLIVDQKGFIRDVFIIAADDQQAAVIQGALARIAKPSTWGWLRRLIGR